MFLNSTPKGISLYLTQKPINANKPNKERSSAYVMQDSRDSPR